MKKGEKKLKRQCTLNQLKQGEEAKVSKVLGGRGFNNKLNAIGLRSGKNIIKINNSFMGGPVTVKIDNSKVAIGSGMADRIFVEVDG